ncbi:MAG: CopD family protein [Pseudomonadota bacterium]
MLATLYPWIKALHLVFVVAWMAGLLMLPRLRIYQLNDEPGGKLFEEMKTASARLRKIILTPAIIMVWALGLALAIIQAGVWSEGWFHAKLALVLVISGLHGYFVAVGRRIDAGGADISSRQLRMMNEAPFVAMIAVIVLVIVRPF